MTWKAFPENKPPRPGLYRVAGRIPRIPHGVLIDGELWWNGENWEGWKPVAFDDEPVFDGQKAEGTD